MAQALYGVFERFACALRSTLFRQLAQWAHSVSDPVLFQVAATDLARGGEQQLWHATFGSEVVRRFHAGNDRADHRISRIGSWQRYIVRSII